MLWCLSRNENMHRLSEKILRDAKITESKLNHLEAWIENEAGRIKDQLREVSKRNSDEVRIHESRLTAFCKPLISHNVKNFEI
jgi:hypothetical protein